VYIMLLFGYDHFEY